MSKGHPTEVLRCHPSSGVERASSSATQGGPIPTRTYVCPGEHNPTDLIRLPNHGPLSPRHEPPWPESTRDCHTL